MKMSPWVLYSQVDIDTEQIQVCASVGSCVKAVIDCRSIATAVLGALAAAEPQDHSHRATLNI